MSRKKFDVIIYIFIMCLGLYYLYTAINLQDTNSSDEVGTGFFPIILSVTLLLFCVIGLFKKTEGSTINFGSSKKILVTIIITVLYFLVWQFIGYFYLVTFIFVFSLLTYYRAPLKLKIGNLLSINIAVSLGMIVFLYILFNKLMYIDF